MMNTLFPLHGTHDLIQQKKTGIRVFPHKNDTKDFFSATSIAEKVSGLRCFPIANQQSSNIKLKTGKRCTYDLSKGHSQTFHGHGIKCFPKERGVSLLHNSPETLKTSGLSIYLTIANQQPSNIKLKTGKRCTYDLSKGHSQTFHGHGIKCFPKERGVSLLHSSPETLRTSGLSIYLTKESKRNNSVSISCCRVFQQQKTQPIALTKMK